MKKPAAKGHTRKQSGTKKHHNTKKHTGTKKHRPDAHQLHEEHLHHEHEEHLAHEAAVHAVAKHPTHAKARSLALSGTGCCAAEALAASLRLAGASVTGADVLALHRLAGADDETGAPVGVLLEAAAEFGLGGFRPLWLAVDPGELAAGAEQPGDERVGDVALQVRADFGEGDVLAALGTVHGGKDSGWSSRRPGRYLAPISRRPGHRTDALPLSYPEGASPRSGDRTRGLRCDRQDIALILGVDLPGPHAVLATADGWWSWGELHCPCEFPDAVIEEAWAVSWS